MKIINSYLILLITSLLITNGIEAQTNAVTSLDQNIVKQQLEYEVKFTSLMLRLGNEIHEDLDRAGLESSIDHQDFLKGPQVNSILNDKIDQYTEFFSKEASLKSTDAERFRTKLREINYTALKSAMKDSFVGLGPFIKRKGRGLVTGLILGTALEIITFGALYMTGLTSVIPYAMIIPYRPLGIVLVTSREQITERLRLINLLGGVSSFRAYKKQRKVASRRLKMTSADQLILPLKSPLNKAGAELESVILSQDSWWHKTLTLLNIQPSSLSYSSLKLFVEMNGMKDIYIDDLLRNSKLPKYLQTLLIVEHIMNTKDEETVIRFMTKYSKNFVKVKALPEWEASKRWTHLLMQAKDVSTIRRLMADPPSGVGAQQILTIWDEIVLPHYSHSYTMTYGQYRALKKEISLLRGYSEANQNNRWDEDFFKLFDQKFVNALNHNLPVCKNPEAKALQFLLSPR